jgi:hypothetical protein
MTAAIANPAFARLVGSLGSDVAAASPTSVEFILEGDVPARLTLHPNGSEVVVDAFACDASAFVGPVHGRVVDTLLRLNALGLRGRFFAIGIDPHGFVAVTSRAPMADLEGGALQEFIDYVAGHARRVRDLVSTLAPPETRQSYSFVQQES